MAISAKRTKELALLEAMHKTSRLDITLALLPAQSSPSPSPSERVIGTALCPARGQHTKWMTQTCSVHAAPVLVQTAPAAAVWGLAVQALHDLQVRQGTCGATNQLKARVLIGLEVHM